MPTGATLDSASGRFQWTPGYGQAGDYTVTFSVTDAGGLSSTLPVNIHIDPTYRAPTLPVANHQVVVGQPFSLQLVGTDLDIGTTLTYSALGMPDGASLDPATGKFQWTPGPTQTGDYIIQFAVSRRPSEHQPSGLVALDDQPGAATSSGGADAQLPRHARLAGSGARRRLQRGADHGLHAANRRPIAVRRQPGTGDLYSLRRRAAIRSPRPPPMATAMWVNSARSSRSSIRTDRLAAGRRPWHRPCATPC